MAGKTIIQPAEDPVAPLAKAHPLAETLGTRVTVETLNHASHAILPEQPAAIAAVMREWLAGMPDVPALQLTITMKVLKL